MSKINGVLQYFNWFDFCNLIDKRRIFANFSSLSLKRFSHHYVTQIFDCSNTYQSKRIQII